MARTSGKLNLSLVMPVLLVGGVVFLLREIRGIGKGASDAAKDAAAKMREAGESISRGIAAKTLPDFNPEATVVKATAVPRQQGSTKWNAYICPLGYRYQKTARGEHLCFKE